MRILKVIIESGPHNYSAYIDGVSGIGVTGKTIRKIKQNIREAVDFYIEVAKEDGSYIPEPLREDFDFIFEMDPETLPSQRVKSAENKVVKVIIEWTPNNYCAYLPDIDGIVTTGDTIAEIKRNMREAIDLSVEVMREVGEPVPQELQGEYELVFELEEKLAERRRKKSATKQKALQPA